MQCTKQLDDLAQCKSELLIQIDELTQFCNQSLAEVALSSLHLSKKCHAVVAEGVLSGVLQW